GGDRGGPGRGRDAERLVAEAAACDQAGAVTAAQVPDRHGQAQSGEGGPRRLGRGERWSGRRDRERPARRAAVWQRAQGPRPGRRPRGRHLVRRALLRQERHAPDQTRRVQAELPARARRADLDHAGGAAVSPAQTYYGKYRGTVVNNVDPMRKGRIQVEVPDVLALT